MDLYREAREFPSLLRGRSTVSTEAQLRESGLTKDTLRWRTNRGPLVRRHRGTYLLPAGRLDLLDLIHAALAVCPPPGALVGYETAAMLHGFGVRTELDRVHVVVPAGAPFPHRAGIVVHQSVVDAQPAVLVGGVPCLAAARCAVDLARTVSRLEALPILDAAIATGSVDREDLVREVKLHGGLRGVIKVRELLGIADGRAECRQESQLRLILHDGGLRGFVPQVEVVDAHSLVRYVIDLGDVRRKVGVEYDGASHLDRRRLRADRARHNWLESRGWRMRYFTDRDIYGQPASVVDVLRVAGCA